MNQQELISSVVEEVVSQLGSGGSGRTLITAPTESITPDPTTGPGVFDNVDAAVGKAKTLF